MKPRLLDLFCGAGGAAMGYSRAGFEVVGVDIKPQSHYPFEFHAVDAVMLLDDLLEGWPIGGFATGLTIRDFDAIHASPPCQAYTALHSMWNAREHPDLVAPTRERLKATGLPYAIENVMGAPMESGIILCGSMFRLGCAEAELRRHRVFESNVPMMAPACAHGWKPQTVAVDGHAGGWSRRARAAVIGVYGGRGRGRRRRMNGQNFPTAARAEAMGIDWMTGSELSQSIPPAFTEYVGGYLMQAVQERAE